MLRALARAAVVAFALMTCGAPAQAQYPNRPVTIMVPLAAGTGMDILVRLYADKLQQALGKPVVVENRPGAALMLAATAVATAPPDGYTLLRLDQRPRWRSIRCSTRRSTTIHDKDFVPISLYVKSPFILVVNPDLPAKIGAGADQARQGEQGRRSPTSSPGAGVAQHLSIEYMKQRFGVEMTHVPYRSTPQSIADIAAGHVALGFAEAGASLPLIKDGKLRALAVSSQTRLPLAARRAAVCRSRQRAGFRGGVVARAARAGEDAAPRSSTGCMPR